MATGVIDAPAVEEPATPPEESQRPLASADIVRPPSSQNPPITPLGGSPDIVRPPSSENPPPKAKAIIDAPAVPEPKAPKAKAIIDAPAVQEPTPLAPVNKPVSIPPDVDVGFGPGVAPPEISQQQERATIAPGQTAPRAELVTPADQAAQPPAPIPSTQAPADAQAQQEAKAAKVRDLISQGQSPGAALAMAEGLEPKTLTGQTPKPPAQPDQPAQPQQPSTDDAATAAQLDKQLGGLLAGKGATYVAMGKKYGVDPRLMAAISMEETGNGTSHLLRTRNNVGGITGKGHTGAGGDYMPYNSIEEGIEAEASLIRHGYVGQGLDTIEKIGNKWAPPDAFNDPEGTNRKWPEAVRKFYAALGGTGKLGETSGKYPSFAGGGKGGDGGGAGDTVQPNIPLGPTPILPGGVHGPGPMQEAAPTGGYQARDIANPPPAPGEPRPQDFSGRVEQIPPIFYGAGSGGKPQPSAPEAESPVSALMKLANMYGGGPGEPPPMKPANVLSVSTVGGPPPAPGLPSAPQAQLGASPKALPAPPAAPAPDPLVIKGLMKRGFTREQAIAFASKATVSKPGAPAQLPAPKPAKAPPPPAPSATLGTGIISQAQRLPPPAKQAPAPPSQEKPPTQFEAASHNMRPLGYRAAVRLTNGEVFSGSEHAHALDNAAENGSIRVNDKTTQYGFVDKKNNFISMEDADRLLEKHWYEQRGLTPPQPAKEPTPFEGQRAGSTFAVPNPPGSETLKGLPLAQAAKAHAGLLSADDPRVKKQKDNMIKGEHFVGGDPFHEQLLGGLPYGKQGRQGQILAQAEQAIGEKQPMHISYISAPAEAALHPTRESRTIQYEEHSPEARLMGTTEGQLVGHSLIPVSIGISPSRKSGEPHQGYIQGISTNVLANNFAHVVKKLAEMGQKSPYEKLGAKFTNDLEGYLSNLNAGHTGTGRGHAVGTADYPNNPDENHVPYHLSRREADFLNTVINNTAAFAKHEDGQALRRLAEANGTLITPEGETNRMRHEMEQHEPGWRSKVLEPSIRTFKTGLIHEIHPSEEHMPATIRPGKEYQDLTKAIQRTSERGRPDVGLATSPRSQPIAGLRRDLAHNAKINKIERQFSEDKITEEQARRHLHAIGENPDEYRFVGGSGGLITPYEEDPEAITHEEHASMKDNLRKQWVGGKLNVEDYRRKVAEVPLPSKPSKLAATTPSVAPPEETPETPQTPAPAPKRLAPTPKPKPAPKAPPGPAAESEASSQVFRKAGNEAGEPDTIDSLKREGHFYRGMTKDEHDATVGAGKGIQSSQKYSTTGEGTSLSDLPSDAESYVNYGRDDPRKTGRPNYLVEAKGGDDIKYDKRDGYHKATAGIPHDRITRAWEMKGDDKGQVVATPHPVGSQAPEESAKPKPPAPDEPLPEKTPMATRTARVNVGPAKPAPPKLSPAIKKQLGERPTDELQGKLHDRVSGRLGSQISGAIPLRPDRKATGEFRTDTKGNPLYEKEDYHLSNTPMLGKKALGFDEKGSVNKAPKGTVDKLDPNDLTYLNPTDRLRVSHLHEQSASQTYADKLVDYYNHVKDNVPEAMNFKDWYNDTEALLKKHFGKDSDLVANLLAATSAGTNVKVNYKLAMQAYHQYKNGDFDRHIDLYRKAHEMKQRGALAQHVLDEGIHHELPKTEAEAMAHYLRHHDIVPRQTHGALFGMNSLPVLKVLAHTWEQEVGGPKTPNYAGNMSGKTLQATADLWVARMMRRLGHEGINKKPWLIQPPAESGLTNVDFALSQLAFRKAAEKIGLEPRQLQAILWGAEQKLYQDRGWEREIDPAERDYRPSLEKYQRPQWVKSPEEGESSEQAA